MKAGRRAGGRRRSLDRTNLMSDDQSISPPQTPPSLWRRRLLIAADMFPEGSSARWLTAAERDDLAREDVTSGLLTLV